MQEHLCDIRHALLLRYEPEQQHPKDTQHQSASFRAAKSVRSEQLLSLVIYLPNRFRCQTSLETLSRAIHRPYGLELIPQLTLPNCSKHNTMRFRWR